MQMVWYNKNESNTNKHSITNTDKNKSLFCDNSLSKPLMNMGKVLVTGASGYVGGILVPELIARGYKVRIMVRETSPVSRTLWPDFYRKQRIRQSLNVSSIPWGSLSFQQKHHKKLQKRLLPLCNAQGFSSLARNNSCLRNLRTYSNTLLPHKSRWYLIFYQIYWIFYLMCS